MDDERGADLPAFPTNEAEAPSPRPASARPESFCRLDYVVAGGVALGALVLYLLTLAPTVTGDDSGELIAAAYTLGIAHPPGYPLWCLLGKLFATVIPFGSVALRVNLLSAVAGAAAIFLLCLAAIKLTHDRPVGALAGAFAALASDVWGQSVIAEVYTLNLLAVSGCLLLLAVWLERRKDRHLYYLALLCGLGLTNHTIMVLVTATAVAFVLLVGRKAVLREGLWLRMGGLFVLGLCVYLYLPLRSAADPAVDWGDPETFQRTWEHVTRGQYRFQLSENPRSVYTALEQSWTVGRMLVWQFTPYLAWLGLPGLWWLWSRRRTVAWLLIALFLAGGPALAVLNNMDSTPRGLNIVRVWYLVAYAVWAIWMACGALLIVNAAVARFASHPKPSIRMAVTTGVACVLAGALVAANFGANNKRHYYCARDFGQCVLDTMEPNAILFAEGDAHAFPAMYLQIVEGQRPDVIQATPYGYIEPSLYGDAPGKYRQRLPRIPGRGTSRALERWIADHRGRNVPVYFSEAVDDRRIPGRALQVEGVLWRLAPQDDRQERRRIAERSRQLLAGYRVRGVEPDRLQDVFAREVAFFLQHARGQQHLHDGEIAEALAAFDAGLAAVGELSWPHMMTGSMLAMAARRPDLTGNERKQMLERALTCFDHTMAVQPESVAARVNKAQTLGALGDHDAAIELLTDTLMLHPRRFRLFSPEIVIQKLAVAHGQRGFERLEAGDRGGAAYDFGISRRLWPQQTGLPSPAEIRGSAPATP